MNELVENIEELRLKAEFLDLLLDDVEQRICTGTNANGYWIDYVNDYGCPIFHANGATRIEAIRNFLACEGEWKKKKAPDESGA